MKEFTLQIELWLPRPRDEIFPFFAEAGNLERIFRYRQQRMKEMFRSVTKPHRDGGGCNAESFDVLRASTTAL
jgi:hypothetical protein